MRAGIIVLCIFAAWWFTSGVVYDAAPHAWVAAGVAISAIVLAWGVRTPNQRAGRRANVGRLIFIWTGLEVLAMIVAGNVLVARHRFDLVLPVFAIIVGLHFFPLARGIPVRFYYATGGALVMLGVIGLLAPPFHLALATGSVAAVILWLSAVGLIRGVR